MVSGSVCSNQFLRKLLFLESLCDSLLISSHPAYQKCKQFNLQKCPESIIYFFPSQLPSPQPFAKTFIILPWRFLILLLSFPPSSAQHPQPFFPKKSDLSLNVCCFFFFFWEAYLDFNKWTNPPNYSFSHHPTHFFHGKFHNW